MFYHRLIDESDAFVVACTDFFRAENLRRPKNVKLTTMYSVETLLITKSRDDKNNHAEKFSKNAVAIIILL